MKPAEGARRPKVAADHSKPATAPTGRARRKARTARRRRGRERLARHLLGLGGLLPRYSRQSFAPHGVRQVRRAFKACGVPARRGATVAEAKVILTMLMLRTSRAEAESFWNLT